jgi:hypothetical protein
MAFKRRPHHIDSVAATLRTGQLQLLSPLNEKSPKGEAQGYLTAMLYLAPHTLAGGKSVCPHSTEDCREGCLFHAGRGQTARVANARIRRTQMYLEVRERFMRLLVEDLNVMQHTADANGMTLAIRLNGTSDIGFEREELDGLTVFDRFPRARFYDYTNWPHQHRRVPGNWHLTYSLADKTAAEGVAHLLAGRNIAAVMPDHDRAEAPGWFMLGDTVIDVVDGEEHDLRFLDPSPALVMLKPKGRLRGEGSAMVRHNLVWNLRNAAKATAA